MARGGVAFELERFGWTGGGSGLEVAGRWRAPRPRRLGPATLAVDEDGRRLLQPIIVTGDVLADPEPTLWRAEYRWPGGNLGSFELEVGSNLIIELPAPGGSPPRGERSGPTDFDPVRAELEAARRQLAANRLETERLRDDLAEFRHEAFEREQATEFLRLAQATAEAERKAVRVAREESAARRAAGSAPGAQPKSAAESAREEGAALRLELERFREEAAAVLLEADRARDELVVVRARAGAAEEEARDRERALEEERNAAIEQAQQLRVRLAAPDTVTTALPVSEEPETTESEATEPLTMEPDTRAEPSGEQFETRPPAQELEDEATDTLVLTNPRHRAPVHQFRPRVFVVAQRTPPVPRRYAERPPKDSPALRAIAGVLLLLLAIVLVTVLVIVA